MRTCDECQVGFSGALDRCPLCGSALAGEPEPAPFPVREAHRPARAARRALAALSVTALVAVLALGWWLDLRPWPVALACVGLAVNYLFLRNVLTHSPDFVRVAERYFLVLLAGTTLWWLADGSPVAASLAIPGLCLVAVLTNAALVVAYRGAFVHDYAKYLIYSLGLGLAPLVLVAVGAASWPWLAWACAGATALLACALLLLARRPLAAELRKLLSA